MLEPIYDEQGKMIAQRFTRPDGSQMLVPPDRSQPAPEPFSAQELQEVLTSCALLKEEVAQSTSTLKEPVLFLTTTLERLIAAQLS